MARDNFNKTTKRILAKRAAYRCSLPTCRKLTVGPGLKDTDVEITGKAAHIYSASKNGPRGQGTLTPLQLRSPSNGIWMCGEHSDLIDKVKGIRYPAPIIKTWKALHEFRVAYEHSDRTSTFGFARSLHVDQSVLFEVGTEIELGKTTFLVGENGTGKTALCEWLVAIDTPRYLLRWLDAAPLDFRITFDAPMEHKLSVSLGTRTITITLDGSTVAINHHQINVAFLRNRGEREYKDDLDHFSNALNLDPVSTRSVAALINSDSLFITASEFRVDQDLYCTLKTGYQMPFANLSGGEKGRVILDFAIAQMRSVAAFTAGLLIIEWPGLSIDDADFESYVEYFSSKECHFQTLITLSERTQLIEGVGWQTYQIISGGSDQPRRVEVFNPQAPS